jgi:uncharacterized membrane protein
MSDKLQSLILTVAMAFIAGHVHSQDYTISQIETPPDISARISAINSSGEIIGTATIDRRGNQRPYFWNQQGVGSLVPNVPTGNFNVGGFNRNGTFVGSYSDYPRVYVQAFMIKNGQFFDLGTPFGLSNSSASDVNVHNQVVGNVHFHEVPSFPQAVLWEKGQMITLTKPEGAEETIASSINKFGIVAGHLFKSGRTKAGLWEKRGSDYRFREIHDAQYSNSEAIQISDRNAVLLTVQKENQYFGLPAVWKREKMRLLPVPAEVDPSNAYTSVSAKRMNNRDQVVGTISYVEGDLREGFTFIQKAVLWEKDEMIDLNELLPEDSGWKLDSAVDINNRGQIVGRGSYQGSVCHFLLTPVEKDLGK